jgi:uncharacterized protein (DUF849 family)
MREPLSRVFITAAVTGNLTKPAQTPHLPITPAEIAGACLEAGEAGAAIAHIHVRDPATGEPSMEPALYREVVGRVRARNPELILRARRCLSYTGGHASCAPWETPPLRHPRGEFRPCTIPLPAGMASPSAWKRRRPTPRRSTRL